MPAFRIGLAQINLTVGDLEGNRKKIFLYMEKAEKLGVDLLSFPEMAITGYPPEDLLLKPNFIQENIQILRKLSWQTDRTAVIVGYVEKGDKLYNAAAVMAQGKIFGSYRKMLLPNYGVFDEKRYFGEGMDPVVFEWLGTRFGVTICEDVWFSKGPCRVQAGMGAGLIMNISASPFYAGKWRLRERVLSERARQDRVWIAFNNLVGGQDELVFDGHGMIHNDRGKLIKRGKVFEEDLIIYDLNFKNLTGSHRDQKCVLPNKKKWLIKIPSYFKRQNKKPIKTPKKREGHWTHPVEEVYRALVLGTKDYVEKNGFSEVVIGLSGGIDSALTAVLAVDALGSQRVVGAFLPSKYTSRQSELDVLSLVKNLNIRVIQISIQKLCRDYTEALKKAFEGIPNDITEENIQARIRGNLLMALSNKFKWLVLTTGNKSEMSVGYATLYGDMAGGFAVIKDVPKMMVYRLARYRNRRHRGVIPLSTLKKEPSAELKPNQKDVDSLPPYRILDPILKAYVEEDRSFSEIVQLGFDWKTVKSVIELVDKSEYKRRQAPPGIKITPRAFGKDRRVPITNRYKSRWKTL